MNNKNLLIIVIVLALVLIGGYFWFAQTNQEVEQTPDNNNGTVNENINENEGANETIDEGVNEEENLNDGSTIVAGNGGFVPSSLTVFPGQEMRVVNNENSDLFLLFQDTEIGPFPSGGSGTFRAPMDPGSFEYRSSLNENIMFILEVEI